MKIPATADLQRWSEELARDPSSLAFLPLARAYRRMGQGTAALQLCLRGLEHYPTHVDAHSLLALLYLEKGDRQRAADAWSVVLRTDPNHFEALRGLGFCYLEQDQLSRARHTLERAALLRPSDPAVHEALRLLGTRQELQHHGATPPDEPWTQSPAQPAAAESAASEESGAATAVAASPSRRPELPQDPTELFSKLMTGPALGALLLDGQGLVLAGALAGGGGDAEAMGALLGGAIGEATRMAAHLSLGDWQGMLLDAETALLHLAPVRGHHIVLFAARRNTPAGWVLRSAAQAGELASSYLERFQ